jgi:hypothetical protein
MTSKRIRSQAEFNRRLDDLDRHLEAADEEVSAALVRLELADIRASVPREVRRAMRELGASRSKLYAEKLR